LSAKEINYSSHHVRQSSLVLSKLGQSKLRLNVLLKQWITATMSLDIFQTVFYLSLISNAIGKCKGTTDKLQSKAEELIPQLIDDITNRAQETGEIILLYNPLRW
jgi:hypothetical protein